MRLCPFTTAPEGPYDDAFGPDGLLRYRYRGTNRDLLTTGACALPWSAGFHSSIFTDRSRQIPGGVARLHSERQSGWAVFSR